MGRRRVRPDSWVTSSWTAVIAFSVLSVAAVATTSEALRLLLLTAATAALLAPLAGVLLDSVRAAFGGRAASVLDREPLLVVTDEVPTGS